MQIDLKWEWSAAAAAEILNLHWGKDEPKAALFQKLQACIYAAMNMADGEKRWSSLEPSDN